MDFPVAGIHPSSTVEAVRSGSQGAFSGSVKIIILCNTQSQEPIVRTPRPAKAENTPKRPKIPRMLKTPRTPRTPRAQFSDPNFPNYSSSKTRNASQGEKLPLLLVWLFIPCINIKNVDDVETMKATKS